MKFAQRLSPAMRLQRESKNSGTNAFDHVYLFQEMRVPSAKRIRDFETLLHGEHLASLTRRPVPFA